MNISLEIPGKTFLSGEYNVLMDGLAILIASKPVFHLEISNKYNLLDPIATFHPKSPSMQYICDNMELFHNKQITFSDPYKQLGGFGASGAQFLATYIFKHLLQDSTTDIAKIDIGELLASYHSYCSSSGNHRPSGADLISQLTGGIALFDPLEKTSKALNWKFSNLGFYLLHTPNNIETHSHLESLDLKNSTNVNQTVKKVQQSIEERNEHDFLEALTSFKDFQTQNNLVCDDTRDMIVKIESIPGVLFAKGCGAKGADVILVITEKNNTNGLKKLVTDMGLKITASEQDISHGAKILRSTL